MDLEKIEVYKQIIDGLEIDQSFKDAFVKFIDTYDGNNKVEYEKFINLLMIVLYNQTLLSSKAQAYDMLDLNQQDFMDRVEEVKKDFKALEEGKYPNMNRISTNPMSEEDDDFKED